MIITINTHTQKTTKSIKYWTPPPYFKCSSTFRVAITKFAKLLSILESMSFSIERSSLIISRVPVYKFMQTFVQVQTKYERCWKANDVTIFMKSLNFMLTRYRWENFLFLQRRAIWKCINFENQMPNKRSSVHFHAPL